MSKSIEAEPTEQLANLYTVTPSTPVSNIPSVASFDAPSTKNKSKTPNAVLFDPEKSNTFGS